MLRIAKWKLDVYNMSEELSFNLKAAFKPERKVITSKGSIDSYMVWAG